MKQINWKDFKIKDLQPNLIENGWDSFEPYGSGENYVENWDFSTNDTKGWAEFYSPLKIQDGKLVATSNRERYGHIYYTTELDIGMYLGRVKYESLYGIAVGNFSNENISVDWHISQEDRGVLEVRFEVLNKIAVPFRIYPSAEASNTLNRTIKIDWIQITPVDNQHLVVEKTPLGNGLTRIQTWGGNSNLKLLSRSDGGWKEDTTYTFSCLVSSEHSVGFRLFNQNQGLIWSKDFGEYMKHTMTLNRNLAGLTHIQAENINDNLDFIASDPQIVEGDKHNPALIVTELDNGQEHVQVYGAYPDTKLISKEVQGFSGEPYQIKTDIDNDGVELTMTSTLGDKSIDVNKGSNSISHTGELQGQHIIIELGAKYE